MTCERRRRRRRHSPQRPRGQADAPPPALKPAAVAADYRHAYTATRKSLSMARPPPNSLLSPTWGDEPPLAPPLSDTMDTEHGRHIASGRPYAPSCPSCAPNPRLATTEASTRAEAAAIYAARAKRDREDRYDDVWPPKPEPFWTRRARKVRREKVAAERGMDRAEDAARVRALAMETNNSTRRAPPRPASARTPSAYSTSSSASSASRSTASSSATAVSTDSSTAASRHTPRATPTSGASVATTAPTARPVPHPSPWHQAERSGAVWRGWKLRWAAPSWW